MVLRYGVALSELTIEWCDAALAELREEEEQARESRRSA
jgi:hypothetical protein